MWSVVGIIGLLVLAVVLLYLPPVQNLVVKKALESVNKSGDMHISVKKLRLGFPLDLTIDSLSMQAPGMDIAAGKAAADIAFMPLLGGNAVVRDLSVNDAIINLGTPDSALYMRSSVKLARLEDANVGLFSNHIDIGRLTASGGDISMIMTPDTVPAPKSESAPATWEINLDKARLEKIGYRMQMLPTIDSLACNLPVAELTHGEISLRHNTINIGEIAISGVDATYIVPTQEYIASHPAPVIQADTTGTVVTPWSITAAKLRLDGSHALYATKGAIPSENFDPAYIEASEIHIAVDSFSNRGSEIRVPLTRLSARERCGIALDASGLFEMDSLSMQAHGFSINTPASKITLDAMMGLDTVNPPLDVRLSASISPDDLKKLTPAAASHTPPLHPARPASRHRRKDEQPRHKTAECRPAPPHLYSRDRHNCRLFRHKPCRRESAHNRLLAKRQLHKTGIVRCQDRPPGKPAATAASRHHQPQPRRDCRESESCYRQRRCGPRRQVG